MNETQRGVRDDTLLSSRKGSRVMTVDKNKYILSINGMSKSFGRNKVLKHINLNVKPGTIMGLMGENGAGKTTTIKLILDIIKKDSGSIRILGRDCTSETTILKDEVGVVLDEVGFQECLTPFQIGHIMKDIFHSWDSSLYDQYLQKFNLPNKKEFGKFSKGMKMKLGIAVALSHHPKLLILDEATSGLDPVMRDEILDIFNCNQQGHQLCHRCRIHFLFAVAVSQDLIVFDI